MKTPILTFLGVLCALVVFGQDNSVLLKNPEQSTFHYIVDPPDLTVFDPSSSIFTSVLFDYFAEGEENFNAISANQVQRLENLSEGDHMLVGFFELADAREYPVRLLKFQFGGSISERQYTIHREPILLYAQVGRGKLRGFETSTPAVAAAKTGASVHIEIDDDFSDWEDIPLLASFSNEFRPRSFSREQYGADFKPFRIDLAKHWNDGGTALAEIKAVADLERIYFYLSTYSVMSENLSIYLYIHPSRQLGQENPLTLEIVPAAGENRPGIVVLWDREAKPEIVGSLESGGFFMEASIEKDAFEISKYATIDLTTCYYDRRGLYYEEFFFETLFITDILPVEETK
ncbi:MAG TPA: hypothetical protein ENI27_03220 [bacterium]|nr:hypothetical protein [bacterium]